MLPPSLFEYLAELHVLIFFSTTWKYHCEMRRFEEDDVTGQNRIVDRRIRYGE